MRSSNASNKILTKQQLSGLQAGSIYFHSSSERSDFITQFHINDQKYFDNIGNSINLSQMNKIKNNSDKSEELMSEYYRYMTRAAAEGHPIYMISTPNGPLETNNNGETYYESSDKSWKKGVLEGKFGVFHNTFMIQYFNGQSQVGRHSTFIHEFGHGWQNLNGYLGGYGHTNFFWNWYYHMRDLYLEIK